MGKNKATYKRQTRRVAKAGEVELGGVTTGRHHPDQGREKFENAKRWSALTLLTLMQSVNLDHAASKGKVAELVYDMKSSQ
jgi:hypothetical protein